MPRKPDKKLLGAITHQMEAMLTFRRMFMKDVTGPWLAAGHRFIDYNDLLLTFGSAFQGSELPEWCDQMESGHCYGNCQELVLEAENLTYWEGMAIKPGLVIPMWHAWIVDQDGRVIDPTWDDPETAVYFGIPFDVPVILEQCSRTGHDAMIESDWMADGWLLREGWKLLTVAKEEVA